MSFVHLHVHSNYSVLDGMSKISDLINKAIDDGMPAMALTDHGNMFGTKEMLDYVAKVVDKAKDNVKEIEKELTSDTLSPDKRNELLAKLEKKKSEFDRIKNFKPIVGVEAYCARRKLTDKDKDAKFFNKSRGVEQSTDLSGHHLILLAKNKQGYRNLCKLISASWIDGYYNRPRIDKEHLAKYHEGLIVSSACLGGEIPQHIMSGDIDKAEETIHWFKSIFGDDFYLEIQRHKTDKPGGDQETYLRQTEVNKIIFQLAEKTNTKVIATNDVHYVEDEHSEAHDRLICLNTGKDLDDPKRMRYTKQEYFKTSAQMAEIFADVPEVLACTLEIVDKIEPFSLDSTPIMPKFDIPETFATEEDYRAQYTEADLFEEFTRNEKNEVILSQQEADEKIALLGGYDKLYRIKLEADYLRKITLEGASQRYAEITPELQERIDFELHVMKTMGFPGYFLIVQDFIQAARNMGVSVGPGRGSAAGSVAAYCLRITDVDPIKYDLLFERFLNPDRISMPDIDIDFDDDGRAAILQWVTEKYGKDRVAHIITFGMMATKSALADVGRVQQVPLSKVNEIKALVPDKFSDSLADKKTGKVPKISIANCIKYVPELQNARNGSDQNIATMLEYASQLEGTVRQTGLHACGIIIGADDLTNFVPLSTAKDKESNQDVLVTQYDGHYVESIGLIKMDFLGLKTLSIIKETLSNIKKSQNIQLDIDTIPIDDKLTYELYSAGKTIGTFQFESPGMQKYLRELQPTVFEDLIAMNALYRPGPMDYIPQFIARKHGREPISYDVPVMEQYLSDTYGVTVYQEQVMLLSRLLANFTRGESDKLRKAMGKKQRAVLDALKPKFVNGGIANGHDPKALDKIWQDWEKFASYAFNKSHATCYSMVSYQTAYLKAHYPAEFMAANLTRNLDNITEITKFMDECRSMRLAVKGPEINESDLTFTVNKGGEIRFGLGAIKGMGEGAVEAIVAERKANGPFDSIYNFVERVSLSACNKKALESLAYAGAFDNMPDIKREQFFSYNESGESAIDILLKYGTNFQADKSHMQVSLFDGFDDEIQIPRPTLPPVAEISLLERLNKERELIGIYLSSHPLDKYRTEIEYGCTHSLTELSEQLEEAKKRAATNAAEHRPQAPIDKLGNFMVAGMITNTREGITRTNKSFGILTLEDYSGQMEFPLFGNDFVTFRNFLRKDLFIQISGRIQERQAWDKYQQKTATPDKPKEIELKITEMQLLEEKASGMLKQITILLSLNKIDNILISELEELCSTYPGRHSLFMEVVDQDNNALIKLYSRKHKVNICTPLVERLTILSHQKLLDFIINNKRHSKIIIESEEETSDDIEESINL